jgi:hypothetical protein
VAFLDGRRQRHKIEKGKGEMGRGIMTGRTNERNTGERTEGDKDTKGTKGRKNRARTEIRGKSLAFEFRMAFYRMQQI